MNVRERDFAAQLEESGGALPVFSGSRLGRLCRQVRGAPGRFAGARGSPPWGRTLSPHAPVMGMAPLVRNTSTSGTSGLRNVCGTGLACAEGIQHLFRKDSACPTSPSYGQLLHLHW